MVSILLALAFRGLKPALPGGYEKIEAGIPMRDGVKLYTAVYVPKGGKNFPLLMERTPYGSGPYAPGAIPPFDPLYKKAGYAFVAQDVRGTYQSEGTFEKRPTSAETG